MRKVLLAESAEFCDSRGMQNDFDAKVRAGLDACRGEWQGVATAAGVSHSWLSQFVRGLIPNPGYETLKKVWAALPDAARSAATDPGIAQTEPAKA
jgi:hypothetical protein